MQTIDQHLAGAPVALQAFFVTPYDQFAERQGQQIMVSGAITAADDKHDAEVLPMFKVRFQDGEEIEVWPEEIASGEADVVDFVARAASEAEANRALLKVAA